MTIEFVENQMTDLRRLLTQSFLLAVGVAAMSCGDPADKSDNGDTNAAQNTDTNLQTNNNQNAQTNGATNSNLENCAPGTYYSENSGSCVPGCLADDDCGPDDFCDLDDADNGGSCENRAQTTALRDACNEACATLVTCGGLVEVDSFGDDPCDFLCVGNADEPPLLLGAGADCVSDWSDGTMCPEELPECVANIVACGPEYDCPDGQTCELDLFECR